MKATLIGLAAFIGIAITSDLVFSNPITGTIGYLALFIGTPIAIYKLVK